MRRRYHLGHRTNVLALVVTALFVGACGNRGTTGGAGGGTEAFGGQTSAGGEGTVDTAGVAGTTDDGQEAGRGGYDTTEPQGGAAQSGAANPSGGLANGGADLGGMSGDETGGTTPLGGSGGATGGAGGNACAGSAAAGGGIDSCHSLPQGGSAALDGRCFTDRECAPPSDMCVGTMTDLVCVPSADACLSNADCDVTEVCDGYCRPATAFAQPCSPGGRCADPGVFCDQNLRLCLGPYAPETCESDLDCPAGGYCSRTGGLDPTLRCHGLAGAGQLCLGVPCADGLCCVPGSDGDPFPRCQAKTGCGVTGDPISCSVFACSEGAHCDYATRTSCVDNLGEGDACIAESGSPNAGATPCASGLYCAAGAGGSTCRKSPSEGEPCVVPVQAPQPGHPSCTDSYQRGCSACADGLYCGEDGLCARYATLGEGCADSACATGLRCTEAVIDGACVGDSVAGAGGSGGSGGGPASGNCGNVLQFADIAVEQAVRYGAAVWGRDLTPADVTSIIYLNIVDYGLGDLSGLECLPNLASLELTGSGIRSLAPLAGAAKLASIRLHATRVDDLRPLANLPLGLFSSDGSPVADLAPLVPIETLTTLSASGAMDCAAQDFTIQTLSAKGVSLSLPCSVRCSYAWSGSDFAVSVANGLRDGCALLSDGTVKCWFANRTFQSGPETVLGLSHAVQVASGNSDSCAVTSEGSVACWKTAPSLTTLQANHAVFKTAFSDAVAVAVASFAPICVLRSDKSVWCWGTNFFAGLGNGDPSLSGSEVPVRAVGLPPIASIGAGVDYVCALSEEGDVYCWGDNSSHAIDSSSAYKVYTPQQVPLPAPARQIAVGDQVCALLADQSVWCWGGYSVNKIKIKGLCDVAALAAAGPISCALLGDGRVQCWGQLERVLAPDEALPPDRFTAAIVDAFTSATSLSLTSNQGCITYRNGSVRCFGEDIAFGGPVPDCVPGFSPVLSCITANACQIAGIDYASGAVNPEDPCLSCEPRVSAAGWTPRPNGTSCDANRICVGGICGPYCQIGSTPYPPGTGDPNNPCRSCQPDQSTQSWSDVPSEKCASAISVHGGSYEIKGGTGYALSSSVSRLYSLSTPLQSIDAGGQHACARLDDGVYCWGLNNYGQIGAGVLGGSWPPTLALTPSSAVSAGDSHTCAVSGGGAYCWGDNESGQLGDGTAVNRSSPVQVSGLTANVSLVSAGWTHSCAIVSGAVRCWGSNAYGQLGDGSTNDRLAPVSVTSLGTAATALTTGEGTTCAIVAGKVWCWGRNSSGELGNGATQNSAMPVAVQGLPATPATAITAGGAHVCALFGSQLYCWGLNASGQLGDGSTQSSSLPVAVTSLLPLAVTDVAAGPSHTCAIANGRAVCWGAGPLGGLTQSLVPALPVDDDWGR